MDLNKVVADNMSAVLELINETSGAQKLIQAELFDFRNEVSKNISNLNDKIGNINENRKLGSYILIK